MQTIKDNLVNILLALIVAAISIMGLMNKSHFDLINTNFQRNFDQMWNKLDRVTTLMMEKEKSVREDQRKMTEELICIGKEVERLKTKDELSSHINGNNKRIK